MFQLYRKSQEDAMSEELLTRKQAVALIGVSPNTFRKLMREANIPQLQFPVGKQKVFYRKPDLDKLLIPFTKQAA
jgi:predicted DNA-binding transcriptional regulator AlpA